MPPDNPEPAAPRRQLNLFDSTCIIVGIIIGAGFYETTPLVASNTSSPAALLGAWLLGGLISLVGAACYAELATAYPREGGEYVFLTRAYGSRTGFVFAWSGFWIVRPGNIGAMAYVFARYAQELWPLPLGAYGPVAYACGAVVLFTGLNVAGVRAGKWAQNVLTAAKVLGLLAVFAVGLLGVEPAQGAPAAAVASTAASAGSAGKPDFGLAMIFVLFAYGGWNEMSYVAAEVRRPQKNLLRALLLGTAAVTAIYLLGNFAFLRALGFEGFGRSGAVAADVLRLRFASGGAAAISVLICVSCLGALNGMILTGARIYYAVGTEHPAYAWLGRWEERRGTPARSLSLQAAVTLALIAGFGLYPDGFNRLVIFTAPVFWFFFLLCGLALPILRRKDPDTPRPYRVLLYPLTPLLFTLSSLYLLYASLRHALANRHVEALWTLGVMAAGVVFSFIGTRRDEGARGFEVGSVVTPELPDDARESASSIPGRGDRTP